MWAAAISGNTARSTAVALRTGTARPRTNSAGARGEILHAPAKTRDSGAEDSRREPGIVDLAQARTGAHRRSRSAPRAAIVEAESLPIALVPRVAIVVAVATPIALVLEVAIVVCGGSADRVGNRGGRRWR